jgi:beta-catenin-like protein 1
MASEEDLDTEIKTFSILSEHPELFGEFRKLGTLGSLVRLLVHENTDIAIDVVEVISELTDDEVEAEPEQWNELVDGMVEESLLEMLSQNLSRLNESNDSDRSGVYHTLSMYTMARGSKTLLITGFARRVRKPSLPTFTGGNNGEGNRHISVAFEAHSDPRVTAFSE